MNIAISMTRTIISSKYLQIPILYMTVRLMEMLIRSLHISMIALESCWRTRLKPIQETAPVVTEYYIVMMSSIPITMVNLKSLLHIKTVSQRNSRQVITILIQAFQIGCKTTIQTSMIQIWMMAMALIGTDTLLVPVTPAVI